MQCPNCGQELTEQDLICPGCGRSFDEPPAPETEQSREPEEPAAAAEAAAPETEESPAVSGNPEEAPEDSEEAPDDSEEASDDSEEASDDSEDAAAIPEDGEGPAEETPDGDLEALKEELDHPKKKKPATATVVLGVIAGLLLVAVVCLTIVVTTLSRSGQAGGPAAAIGRLFHRISYKGDAVAVQVTRDGESLTDLTNDQLSFYYWGEFYYFVQNNGFSFDVTTPLDQQEFSEGMTWQDYFLEGALDSIKQTEALKAEAAQAGFTMPETYQSQYDATIGSMADYALQAGFTNDAGEGDVEGYVKDSYGSTATLEGFEQYLYDSYFVSAYTDSIYESQTYEEAELTEYYDQNADAMAMYGITKSDLPNVNVRHILIKPEELAEDASEADQAKAKDAAKEEAERIYQLWKDGEATEESFAALAEEYSTDAGSGANGGLYEDVYPGQMVPAFNDWCFDSARKPGDTGIVESDYGYHIMYFSGTTDNYYWKDAVGSEVKYNKFNQVMEDLLAHYSAVRTDKLAVTTPDAVTEIFRNAAENAAADSAAG